MTVVRGGSEFEKAVAFAVVGMGFDWAHVGVAGWAALFEGLTGTHSESEAIDVGCSSRGVLGSGWCGRSRR